MGNGVDLSRLNEAERQVLLLLAEGHTAKSVANELGSTAAAVNERLREARRKTGVGSSRELARLLKSQENRHDELGMASNPVSAPNLSGHGASTRRHQEVRFGMVGLFIIVMGASALISDVPPSAPKDIDPLIGEALPKFVDPSDLHTKVRSEKRDTEWATPLEAAIRTRVSKIPLLGTNGNELRVLCGSTLCEISGSVLAPASAAEREDQNSQFNRTIKDLQVPPLPDDLGKLGLKHESGLFTGAKGKPDRSVFLLYYSRAK
ncbi:MAG: helix-turn-helix transcriptional regulator [Sphingomonas sp.]|nr:helix-turn-helix transcriptional regulator [Sphingomonas sp.]